MSSKAKQSQKLLLFRLSGERLFGIGTLKIREILPFMRLTKLPHSHHAVIGNLSGFGCSRDRYGGSRGLHATHP